MSYPMLQRLNKPRLDMFLVALLLITLLQMMVQQARAAAFITSDRTHPCQVENGVQPDDASAEKAQSSHACCETPDCHNPACQNLCASGTAVTAPGIFLLPPQAGSNIYHTFPVVSFSNALTAPPFHPPRQS